MESNRYAARVMLAQRLYKARVDRRLFFREALFGEAGWDSLLALYLSDASGITLTARQLRRASGEVALSSALRLQRRLADIGVARRFADPGDRRRILIELTPAGRGKIEDYLDHLIENYLAPGSVWRPSEPPEWLKELQASGD